MSLGELRAQTGLLGLWHFNGDANDSSGNSLNGTLQAHASVSASGKFANGLTLDGTDDYMSLVDGANLRPTTNFTVCCWFKVPSNLPETGWTAPMLINSNYDYSVTPYKGFALEMYNSADANKGKLRLTCYASTSSTETTSSSVTSATTYHDDKWHYVVAVKSGSDAYLYIDGSLDGSSSSMIDPTYNATTYASFGRRVLNPTTFIYIKGVFDECTLFSVAKSASWARKQYSLGRFGEL